MRISKGLLVGLAVVGLTACSSGGGSALGKVGISSAGQAVPSASSAAAAGGGAVPSPAAPAATSAGGLVTRAPSMPSPAPSTVASARTAATQFYDLYAASRYQAAWDLLAPATKSQISAQAWTGVHQACSSTAGEAKVIKAVTVFGNAAIVAENAPGVTTGTVEDVFNYVNGGWRYSPQAPGIYEHGSVTADIAAAKAVGLCPSSKIY
jgi:hypothetical protein